MCYLSDLGTNLLVILVPHDFHRTLFWNKKTRTREPSHVPYGKEGSAWISIKYKIVIIEIKNSSKRWWDKQKVLLKMSFFSVYAK